MLTHWDAHGAAEANQPGSIPELLFTPDHMLKRRKKWGVETLAGRLSDAWWDFLRCVMAHFGVERVYVEVLGGRAPERAHVSIAQQWSGRANQSDLFEIEAEMERQAIPEGFSQHFKQSPMTDPWEPLFSRRCDQVVHLGLWLRNAHCNSRGFVHGGVIAALADNAMGISCVLTNQAATSAVTVSLSVDYVATAKIGQWLQIEPRVVKAGSTLGFVDALISADRGIIARASATFRMLA